MARRFTALILAVMLVTSCSQAVSAQTPSGVLPVAIFADMVRTTATDGQLIDRLNDWFENKGGHAVGGQSGGALPVKAGSVVWGDSGLDLPHTVLFPIRGPVYYAYVDVIFQSGRTLPTDVVLSLCAHMADQYEFCPKTFAPAINGPAQPVAPAPSAPSQPQPSAEVNCSRSGDNFLTPTRKTSTNQVVGILNATSGVLNDAIPQLDKLFEQDPCAGFQFRTVPARIPQAAPASRILWGSINYGYNPARIYKLRCDSGNVCIYLVVDAETFDVGVAGRGLVLDRPLDPAREVRG